MSRVKVDRYVVATEDGDVEVTIRAGHRLAAEREFAGRDNAGPVERMLWLLWRATGSPEKFDKWVGSVIDWDTVERAANPEPPDPTDAPSHD